MGWSDADELNNLEKVPPEKFGSTMTYNDGVFGVDPSDGPMTQGLYRQNSQGVDPPGIWMKDYASDPVNEAILAAIYMHLWQTPVYANAYNSYPDSRVAPIVIEKVRLCSDQPQPPHIVCGWNNYNSAIDPNTSNPSGFFCPSTVTLTVHSVTFRFFPHTVPEIRGTNVFQEYITDSITLPGAAWATSGFWGCVTNDGSCQIIFDPPEEDASPSVLASIRKLASKMEEQTLLGELNDSRDQVLAVREADEYKNYFKKVMTSKESPVKEDPRTDLLTKKQLTTEDDDAKKKKVTYDDAETKTVTSSP